ncbi:MAG: hypothetical protein LBI61_02990 [Puniceicoccales bacterium]|jgi:lipopolysaccharide biosynthesis glycosyltransferase|nr:hypothetical protein [Puniceicoccales bacterium]
MQQTINIAFSFDDKFADVFCVAACSAAKNTASNLAIYIVDCGISDENKEKILRLREKCPSITGVKIGAPKRIDVLEKFHMASHFSPAVFYRLAIPKVFPELERVIYVDCDVVVDGDIVELWREDLASRPFGAIEEEGNFFNPKMRMQKVKTLSMPAENHYYNSGVLLIDCSKFEESRIFERVIECVRCTKIFLPCTEQDAMNICLKNDEHMPLSPRYNFCPSAPLARKTFRRNRNVVIVHYSMCKPWLTNERILAALYSIGMFRYSTSFLLKFWQYANEFGFKRTHGKSVSYTFLFLYKRIFQPIERFVSEKIRDNVLDFFRKHFRNKASCRIK